MTTQEITTTIKENGVLIHGQNGEPSKTISFQDYMSGLLEVLGGNSSEQQDNDQETCKNPFLLPPNVYLFYPGKTYTEVGMFYRERKVPSLKHVSKKAFKDFPMPNVVISVRLKTSSDTRNRDIAFSLDTVRFFATDRGPLSLPKRLILSPDDKNHIWTLPLPNMYADGRMCYGANSVISTYTHDLRTLHMLYRMIHESPFNNDLGVHSLAKNRDPVPWLIELAEAGKEAYPYQLLRGFSESKHQQNQAEFKYTVTSTE